MPIEIKELRVKVTVNDSNPKRRTDNVITKEHLENLKEQIMFEVENLIFQEQNRLNDR